MRVIIAGSRTISAPWKVVAAIERSGLLPVMTEVVVGGARGVDQVAEEWARRRGLPVRVFRPDYDQFEPKRAPLIRNGQMADYAREGHDGGALILIHDGRSRGSLDMLRKARQRGLAVYYYQFEPDTPAPITRKGITPRARTAQASAQAD